jgi:hypothetical protein
VEKKGTPVAGSSKRYQAMRASGKILRIIVSVAALCCLAWLFKPGAEVRERPARRASDKPHSFEPTAGFRTCRICGLPRSYKVHNAETRPASRGGRLAKHAGLGQEEG